MSAKGRRLVVAAACVAGTGQGLRWYRQRRRHLALMPITVSTRARMTFWRCRRDATLRNRALAYDSEP